MKTTECIEAWCGTRCGCYEQGKAQAIKEVLEKIDDMIKSYACFNDYDEMTVWDIRDDFEDLKASLSSSEGTK